MAGQTEKPVAPDPELYATVRATFNTGRKQGLSAVQAIEATRNGEPLVRPG